MYTLKTKIFILFLTAFFFPYLAFAQEDDVKTRLDSISTEINKIYLWKIEHAYNLVDTLYAIARSQPKHPEYFAMPLYWDVFLTNSNWMPIDTAIITKIDSIARLIDERHIFEKNLLKHTVAIYYISTDQFIEAFQELLTVLNKYKEIGNKEYTIKALCDMIEIFMATDNYNVADIYYQEAFALVDVSDFEYYYMSIDMYRTKILSNNSKENLDSLKQLIPKIKKQDNPTFLAMSYLTLLSYYSSQGDFNTANLYCDSILTISQDIDYEKIKIIIYNDIGVHKFRKKDMQAAYNYYQKAYNLIKKRGNNIMFLRFYSNFSSIFDKMNQQDSAYFYLRKYRQINNALQTAKNLTTNIYQNYMTSTVENYQNKIKISEQALQLKKKQAIIIILIGIAIILSISSFLIILNQQKRNLHHKAIINELENNDLKENLKNKERIECLQREKLESKIREITSYSLLLASKNTILQEIAACIQSFGKKGIRGKDVSKKATAIINKNINLDKDWNTFLLHFNEVHPDFFNKLKTASNSLSENDLRLCAYIKIGLPTKDLSQILNIIPESIRMHRYRIKKKLNLPEDQSLDDFIRNI